MSVVIVPGALTGCTLTGLDICLSGLGSGMRWTVCISVGDLRHSFIGVLDLETAIPGAGADHIPLAAN
jgi:hypothetical protein